MKTRSACCGLPQAMFKLYKAKDRTVYFWIEHWGALLKATRLIELAGVYDQ